MIVSAIVFNPIVAARASRLFEIRTIEPLDCVMVVFGSVALAACALDRSPLTIASACGALVFIGLAMLWPLLRQPRAIVAENALG
jgi:hypothetical protein